MIGVQSVVSFLLLVGLSALIEGAHLSEVKPTTTIETIKNNHIDEISNFYCKCMEMDCKCCFAVSSTSGLMFTVCLKAEMVLINSKKDELAIQGTVSFNNASIFTWNFRISDLPQMCYTVGDFITCLSLRQEFPKPGELKVCGHIYSHYSTLVTTDADFLCSSFRIQGKKPTTYSFLEKSSGDVHFKLVKLPDDEK